MTFTTKTNLGHLIIEFGNPILIFLAL